ncbi:MAG: ABC transporter ATP-binding protein [Alphaproteobacteria bacterium]|nr:ABC transporter ATP-binding protein [Alphaproteobacteria bacterium]
MRTPTTPIASVSMEKLGVVLGGRPVLNDIDLPPLTRGEVLAVVGPNGAGKTSFMRCLCGLLRFTGRLILNGEVVAPLARHRRHWAPEIGYVPQNPTIQSRISVLELLLLAQKSHDRSLGIRDEELERAERILDRLDIRHLGQRFCPDLSGGQMQMVALAQALVLDPSLLLLDEPTSALDLRHQSRSLKLICDYSRSLASDGLPRAATIFILHDLNLALRHADRVLVLDQGRVVAHGSLPGSLSLEVIQKSFDIEGEFVVDSKGWNTLVVY